MIGIVALALALVPMHGYLLTRLDPTHALVRIDAITRTMPSRTLRVVIPRTVKLEPSGEFDALGERAGRNWRLVDVRPALRFVAGMPNPLITHILQPGDSPPGYEFVDQRGRPVTLGDFRGKVVILSFVFTRCTDICPFVSAKYAYLQKHLDPAHFHLVEVTLDPTYDSPAVMAAYGRRFGADPRAWSMLTGESAQIKDTFDAFGISSVKDAPNDFQHDDRLTFVGRDGKIASIIPTDGWSADDVIAQARSLSGLSSNPLRRLALASIAGVASLCGGSTTTAVVVLDSVVFLLGVGILGSLLAYWGRRIFVER
ncbi:MAG: SCO family protein [Vulcanimicrobiaceae bacterium]